MKLNIKDLALKSIVGIAFILALIGGYKISNYKEKAHAIMEQQNITDRTSDEAVKIINESSQSAASYFVNLGIVLLVIGLFLVLASTVYNMLMNPKGLKKTLLGLAIFVVLLVVAYFLADSAEMFGAANQPLLSREDYSQEQITSLTKWSGAGLNLTYILLSISGLLFVVDLFKSLIKS